MYMLQPLTDFIVGISSKLVGTIESGNYGLIVLLIAIESSFIPFPSEIVMIPAGILVFQGKMSFTWAVVAGIVGSLIGSLFNYYLAIYAGRPLIAKYGKYFLIDEKKLASAESYFEKHGPITTFVCRLIPGVRQIISFPAGLCRMNLWLFCLYTTLGAGIWMVILTWFGHYVGSQSENWQTIWSQHSKAIILGTIAAISVISVTYILIQKKKKKKLST